MDIIIKGETNFKYQFFIDLSDSAGSSFGGLSNSGAPGEVRKWCLENCKSRYLISSNMAIGLYHPVPATSPFPEVPFKPSSIEIRQVFLVAFEDDEEATGFKITFLDNKN